MIRLGYAVLVLAALLAPREWLGGRIRRLAPAWLAGWGDGATGGLLLASVLAAIWGGFVLGPSGLVCAVGPTIVFLAWRRDRRIRRRMDAERALPGCLELLGVLLGAGMGRKGAIAATAEGLAPGALRDAFASAVREIAAGGSTTRALDRAAAALALRDLSRLARALRRAEELGAPAVGIVERAASRARCEARLRLEQQAAEASVRITLPLILTFFPAVVLLLVGPIALMFFGG